MELKRTAEREYVDPRPTREAPQHSTRMPARPKKTNACAPSWHATNTFARGTVSMGRYFPTCTQRKTPQGNKVQVTNHARLTNGIQRINIGSHKVNTLVGKVRLTTPKDGISTVTNVTLRGKLQSKLVSQVRLVNWG